MNSISIQNEKLKQAQRNISKTIPKISKRLRKENIQKWISVIIN
jgi:hypothetical protein